MAEVLSDDAIRFLNAQGAAAAQAAIDQAAAEAAQTAREQAAAVRKARLQPFEDAIQLAAKQLDAELAAIRSSEPWQAAQQAVGDAYVVLSLAARKGDAPQEQSAYDAAIATRDAFTAKALIDHDAAVRQPLAALAAEIAAIDGGVK